MAASMSQDLKFERPCQLWKPTTEPWSNEATRAQRRPPSLLNCRLRHLKKDGSLLSERANVYVMVKVTGRWKVGGIMPQDPALFER